MFQKKFKVLHIVTATVVSALAAGCATNPYVLGFAYDRVDDRLVDRFETFAEFDASQSEWIDARMTHWHAWHRRTQLPRYARFLSALGTRLSDGPPPSLPEIRAFATRADGLYQSVAGCHPLTATGAFLATLTDTQINDIEARLAERVEENGSDEVAERIDRTVSGLSRLGFSFDARARAEVAAHFARAPDIQRLRARALEAWSRQLVALLAERRAPEFGQRIEAHMGRALSLTRTAYPEQVAANVDSWIRMLHAIVAGYDDGERADVGERLIALGAAVAEVSQSGRELAPGPRLAGLGCAL